MSRWKLVAAWLLVATVATTLTWQVVSAADDRVNDRPVAALAVTSTAGAQPPSPTSVDVEPAPTSTSPSTSVAGTTPGPAPAPTSSSSSTTTTMVGSSPQAEWKVETIITPGGTLVVSYRPGEVRYESASPLPGFSLEMKKAGPPDVEVEFEGPASKVEVKVTWRDGALSVVTDSEAGDD